MKKITKAMIFAAGFGKRLVPLTEKTPKPLLQLNGKTLLENCVLFLEDCGIKEIVINVHHLADQIIEFIQKNTQTAVCNSSTSFRKAILA